MNKLENVTKGNKKFEFVWAINYFLFTDYSIQFVRFVLH